MVGTGILTLGVATWVAPWVGAVPAPIFQPYLTDMVANVPPGYPLRLPDQIRTARRYRPQDVRVEVFASKTPLSLTVSLFTCDNPTTPCLLGSITTDRASAVHAIAELTRHQKSGDPVTLRKDIRAYLVDGLRQKPVQSFSSIAWRQDDVIYTLNFPVGDREGLVAMAGAMVRSEPIRAPLPRSLPASLPPELKAPTRRP